MPRIRNTASTILNPREVAEYLKVSYITVLRWLDRGEIPGKRMGPHGHWRTRRVDLDRLFFTSPPHVTKRTLSQRRREDELVLRMTSERNGGC